LKDPVDQALGLCRRCVHQREVVSARGSRFAMCGKAQQDAAFSKYPRLPMLECAGFEPGGPHSSSSSSTDP
jgi:hypothetical protein